MVDWDFLELIYSRRNDIPHNVSEKERKNFVFDAARYHDAVVMPWYRNQDQPQVDVFLLNFTPAQFNLKILPFTCFFIIILNYCFSTSM